jgi:hypothetical protein
MSGQYEGHMLLAREQLRFVQGLMRDFSADTSDLLPLTFYQAQHVAIIAMLRSIGHVFVSVDCDTPERKQWQKTTWRPWGQQPIFKEFIKPTRDALLKEFRGTIRIDSSFVTSHAFSGPHSIAFVALQLDRGEGKALLTKLEDAMRFWDRYLLSAEHSGKFT